MAVTPSRPVRPSQERIDRLNELADWQREWSTPKLDTAPFNPAGRPTPSDYNEHFVDLDADDDAFHERAREILAG